MSQNTIQEIKQEVLMPLIRVAKNGQITLPSKLRKELAIEAGDYVEAELRDGGVFFRPQVTLDREQAVKALHSVMDKVQSRTEKVEPEVIEQEVVEAIQAMRKHK